MLWKRATICLRRINISIFDTTQSTFDIRVSLTNVCISKHVSAIAVIIYNHVRANKRYNSKTKIV